MSLVEVARKLGLVEIQREPGTRVCYRCREPIEKGERYRAVAVRGAGRFAHTYQCTRELEEWIHAKDAVDPQDD